MRDHDPPPVRARDGDGAPDQGSAETVDAERRQDREPVALPEAERAVELEEADAARDDSAAAPDQVDRATVLVVLVPVGAGEDPLLQDEHLVAHPEVRRQLLAGPRLPAEDPPRRGRLSPGTVRRSGRTSSRGRGLRPSGCRRVSCGRLRCGRLSSGQARVPAVHAVDPAASGRRPICSSGEDDTRRADSTEPSPEQA